MSHSPFRLLPSVSALLSQPALIARAAERGQQAVTEAARWAIDEARQALARGEDAAIAEPARLAQRALALLDAAGPALRPVINATGVLLHTGLGRAPLAAEAIAAIAATAGGYTNLEFDLATGERGRRTSSVAALLCRLTGAEAATVVNNNAAATVLALRALASGREVVVSRGQLVEIGGSFRLPEIFAVSGARLREVGTTNKTRLSDYVAAINPMTAALLRVHASNFRIVGFTEDVPIDELAALAKQRGLLSIDDIGSGALGPGRPPHVGDEPTIAASLRAGADLVLCSGDKLLGGPQCGLLLGTKPAIARLAADPLMRALRVDKLALAALEATLHLALDPARACARIPLWAFLNTPIDKLRQRAERLAEDLRATLGLAADVITTEAMLGGGSVPAAPLPSAGVRLVPPFPSEHATESVLAAALRRGQPAVVARVHEGALVLDLRAVGEAEDALLIETLRRALGAPSQEATNSNDTASSPPPERQHAGTTKALLPSETEGVAG